MKLSFVTLLLTISSINQCIFANSWTEVELNRANTCKGIEYLNKIEKNVILYLNLARMFPKKFARLEVMKYSGPSEYGNYLKNSKYKSTLIRTLNRSKPVSAFTPSMELSLNAKCLAKEQEKSGAVGHKRKKCKKENFAECCSYGMKTGLDIVLQLLIDHNVNSLGHRKICLDSKYSKIGIGYSTHKKHNYCCVIEFQ